LQRDNLKELFAQPSSIESEKSSYWINPRVFPNETLIEKINGLPLNYRLSKDETLIAAHLSADHHNSWINNGLNISGLKEKVYSGSIEKLDRVWEIFKYNGREIVRDLERIKNLKLVDKSEYQNVTIFDKYPIYIEEGVTLEPGVILYANDGPIYIGKGVRIMANAVVRGPSAICRDSVVKMGAKIDKETTIGPVCKVGGEISNVVFHSYSNKSHDGFTGNSVFGQWCNLGADTNTSNLKNNYSSVRIQDWETGETTDTGEQFLGTIMGDHSKTGINAMLNTGTVCGVCCNLFSTGYQPKYVPSFSWVGQDNIMPYHFEKAVEAMEKMMQRRDVELSPAYKQLMRTIFESSAQQ
jgi:UDP-N-acetylglucosamine diphosphorylase/glucosamine-1-phosphate N-acetyltransferase